MFRSKRTLKRYQKNNLTTVPELLRRKIKVETEKDREITKRNKKGLFILGYQQPKYFNAFPKLHYRKMASKYILKVNYFFHGYLFPDTT
jgi:hypothetical protein